MYDWKVARLILGDWAKTCVKGLHGWDDSNMENFLQATCYKVNIFYNRFNLSKFEGAFLLIV